MFFYLLYKYTLRNAWYGRQELNEKGKFAKDILAKKHIPHKDIKIIKSDVS